MKTSSAINTDKQTFTVYTPRESGDMGEGGIFNEGKLRERRVCIIKEPCSNPGPDLTCISRI